MMTKRVGEHEVVVAQNRLERDLLARLLQHMSYDGEDRYWDVYNVSADPLTHDDSNGRIHVSWEDNSKTRRLDPFSICRNEHGAFIVVKMPHEAC